MRLYVFSIKNKKGQSLSQAKIIILPNLWMAKIYRSN